MTRHPGSRFVGFASAVLVLACGGSAPPPREATTAPVVRAEEPARGRGDVSATARIGRAGGTLELTSGVKLEVPAGAISEPIDLSLSYGSATSAFANREDERPLGRVIVVAPAFTSEGPPVVLSVPEANVPEGFRREDVAVALETQVGEGYVGGAGTPTRWEYGAATSDGRRLRAELRDVRGLRIQFLVSRGE